MRETCSYRVVRVTFSRRVSVVNHKCLLMHLSDAFVSDILICMHRLPCVDVIVVLA